MPNFIHGSEGNVALGATNDNVAVFNTWSATVTRSVHDITGYTDIGRRRILGLMDVTGSAGGTLKYNASNTAPNAAGSPANSTTDGTVGLQAADATGADITLTFATGNTWVFKGIIDSMAATSTMGGDTTITMNFQMSGGEALVETWDETA
jgi:hypothetical protein